MTIARARQLLGTKAVNLSEQEIGNLITSVGGVCDSILDVIVADIESAKKTPLTPTKFLPNNGSS